MNQIPKRPLASAASWALGAYRSFISPLLGPRCRFVPSCSQYAEEAFESRPAAKAVFLIAVRLLRCQPFHPGGFDPVPH